MNTCSVREKAQEKVFSLLGEWRRAQGAAARRSSSAWAAAWRARRARRSASARPYVDLVFGPQTLHRLPEMIAELRAHRPPGGGRQLPGDREVRSPAGAARRRRARLRVDHGGLQQVLQLLHRAVHARRGGEPAASARCWRRCARSPRRACARSRCSARTSTPTRGAMADGAPVDLATLIHHVARVPGIERIRFTTSHPLRVQRQPDRGISRTCRKLANHLHLPVQSARTGCSRS